MATVCALPKEQKMAPVQSLSPGAAVPSMYFVFTKQCSGLSPGKKKKWWWWGSGVFQEIDSLFQLIETQRKENI